MWQGDNHLGRVNDGEKCEWKERACVSEGGVLTEQELLENSVVITSLSRAFS